MARSTGISRDTGVSGITRIVRTRTRAITVTRVSTSKGSLDETTETTSEHSESVWLFEPRESSAEELAGERINGALGGLVIADGSVDLQRDDRVTYGGVEYEIDTIIGQPVDGEPGNSPDTDYWVVSFVRRQ